jgi:hypothetical protein
LDDQVTTCWKLHTSSTGTHCATCHLSSAPTSITLRLVRHRSPLLSLAKAAESYSTTTGLVSVSVSSAIDEGLQRNYRVCRGNLIAPDVPIPHRRADKVIVCGFQPTSPKPILFSKGGGTTQSSAVMLNLLAYHRLQHDKMNRNALYTPPALDYVIQGAAEAKRLVQPSVVGRPLEASNSAASTTSSGFRNLSNWEDHKSSKDPAFGLFLREYNYQRQRSSAYW